MDIDKIAVGRERLNCGFALPLEVGVEISGCALHRDAAQPHREADAVQQVDRRNHPAAHTVERFKWLQSGPGALAPEPDAEGGIFARGASGGIDRMIPECLEGIAHHFQQQRRVLPLGEMAANRAAGDIVRRGLGAAGFRIAQHQTVAIAHTGIKFNLAAAEFFLHHGNELGGLPARNFPCAVIEHRLILERGLIRKGDEVAAVGHVVRPELYPQADRFKRGTPV